MQCATHRRERTSGKSFQVMQLLNMELLVTSNGSRVQRDSSSRRCQATTSELGIQRPSRYSIIGISTVGSLKSPDSLRFWLNTLRTSSKRTFSTTCQSLSSLKAILWMLHLMLTKQWRTSSTPSMLWKTSRSEHPDSSSKRTRNRRLMILRKQFHHRDHLRSKVVRPTRQSYMPNLLTALSSSTSTQTSAVWSYSTRKSRGRNSKLINSCWLSTRKQAVARRSWESTSSSWRCLYATSVDTISGYLSRRSWTEDVESM